MEKSRRAHQPGKNPKSRYVQKLRITEFFGGRKKREAFAIELKDALQSLSAHMQIGYSMENAWREVYKEMVEIHGADAVISRELQRMIQQLNNNVPIEKLLLELSERHENEDLKLFAELVAFAKRGGGNFLGIMKTTIAQMGEKAEVDREIQVMTAGKRMEQRIMCVVPLGIVLYLMISSPGYLDVLLTGAAGILLIIACTVAYLLACFWGRKLVDIKV